MPSVGKLAAVAAGAALSLRAPSSTSPLAQCSNSDWDALNQTVRGRLFRATPLALPCFSEYEGKPHQRDDVACKAIEANYTNGVYRASMYSSFPRTQNEMCPSDPTDQCLLDSTTPTDMAAYSNGTSCNQGSIAPYAIAVNGASDVKAAFKFASKHKIPLSIKASGHDYFGRNSGKNSLGLWTRPLQKKAFDASFTPEGCKKSVKYRAITVGAGVLAGEMYDYVDSVNSTVAGPYSNSVGGSMGWTFGGGQHVLAPTLGIGVDRPRQFRVVTPDGKELVANECQNTDLFWALRGGGGGTFGFVLETTVEAAKTMPLAVASMNFTSTSANVRPWFKLLAEQATGWGNEKWGGHIVGDNNILYVNPHLSLEEAEKSMKTAANFVHGQNGTVVIEMLPNWLTFFNKYVVAAQGPTGVAQMTVSRLIPGSIFKSDKSVAALVDILGDLVDAGYRPYIPAATPWTYTATPRSDTSTTPAWSDALWHLEFSIQWAWNSHTLENRTKTWDVPAQFQTRLDNLTPGSGSYMNEAAPFLSDWQEQWWGEDNYKKLLAIKRKYDPNGLLYCHRCVGSENPPKQYSESVGCWAGIHKNFQ